MNPKLQGVKMPFLNVLTRLLKKKAESRLSTKLSAHILKLIA